MNYGMVTWWSVVSPHSKQVHSCNDVWIVRDFPPTVQKHVLVLLMILSCLTVWFFSVFPCDGLVTLNDSWGETTPPPPPLPPRDPEQAKAFTENRWM